MSDTDTTPRTGNKVNTDPSMPSAELINYQLKELRNSQKDISDRGIRVEVVINDMKTQLALGKDQLMRHDSEISEIRRAAHKATFALISAIALVAWELLKLYLPVQPH